MTTLPLKRPYQLTEKPRSQTWLIESLWLDDGVGIVGGQPKCCKSLVALDIAVSVASGRPCLGRFAVPAKGAVLLFAAEDALHIVRQRLALLCTAKTVCFEDLDIHVIVAPTVRLDIPEDRDRLYATVEQTRPKLLILDPFVRLHRIDENTAGDVAPLLAFLRTLNRAFHAAVLLVHHAKKNSGHARAGQALRGSSELHAWGDSNLYLRRANDDRLTLSAEHRAAPNFAPIALRLAVDDHRLELLSDPIAQVERPTQATSPEQRIATTLAKANQPLALRDIRTACQIKTQTLCKTLADLTAQGLLTRLPDGRYQPA